MQYYNPDFQSNQLQQHYRTMADQCTAGFEGGERTTPCNIATAHVMQNNNAFEPVKYRSSIPRDFLTLTNQPSRNPQYPSCYKNINKNTCKSCETPPDCMDDRDKQKCFECAKKTYKTQNKILPCDPYAKCFFFKYVKPE